jgi:hypothetical protein
VVTPHDNSSARTHEVYHRARIGSVVHREFSASVYEVFGR